MGAGRRDGQAEWGVGRVCVWGGGGGGGGMGCEEGMRFLHVHVTEKVRRKEGGGNVGVEVDSGSLVKYNELMYSSVSTSVLSSSQPHTDPRVTHKLKELLVNWSAEFKSAPHMK